MQKTTMNRRESGLLSRASVFALASATIVSPQLAFAQDAAVDDEIVVTGSRIPSTNASSTSPVTTIGNVEFDIRGTSRVEDLVNTLPQAFAAQGANTSNGATGTAQVSLRGLGPNRTLVLVDGRRLQYGSAISSAPDLNQIPSALVERVDVLSGGASAVYGSDAIAGVVNFIMVDDFEGVRIDGQLSGYQHTNNNDDALGILDFRGFAPPEKGVFDGKGQEITLMVGANTEDGRGNVTAYAGYRNNDLISQADRDYSACQYGGGTFTAGRPFGFGCSGSGTTDVGVFATPTGTFTLDENGPGNTLRPTDVFTNALSNDAFNFAPTNFYQRPDERYILGAFARYEINDHVEAYSQAMFYDYTSDAQIAFSGTFFVPNTINCDNPLMSAQVAATLCGANAGLPVNATVYTGKRLTETGAGRNDHIRLTSYRIVAGIRGDLFEGWTYDAFLQYGNTHNAQQYQNDVSLSRTLKALDVILDTNPASPTFGTAQCRSLLNGTDPACVPLNVFQIGGVTPAAAAYVSVPSFQDGDTFQYMGQVTFTGDLGQYGMQSPWAEDGIGIAGGVEWRKDQLNYNPDALFQSGDLTGQGATTPPVSGSIENTDFFVEAEIPLVTGVAFAESFKFNGGYRHSDVSTAGGYSTWKLQGDWQITPDVRVRGGWQRAARAPNVIETFLPQRQALTALPATNGLSDPCAGATPNATAAQCANTGVTAAQYGNIQNNPANQYNGIFAGSTALDPEVSDTYTAGVVLTPEFVPGNLFLSVDYFDIFVDDFIAAPSASNIMTQCLNTGDPFFCSKITRTAGNGSLFLSNTGFFTLTNVNTGSLATSGIDVNGNHSFDIGSAGGIAFDLVATYLLDFSVEEVDGKAPAVCDGKYGGTCDTYAGVPLPVWRHKLRATWEMPIGVDTSVTWRYFSSVDLFGVANPDPSVNRDHTLGSRNYIDLAASYNVTEKWNVRVGVNNLLDKDPPVTAQQTGFTNGNTYPQTYDAQGRYLFLGTTIDF